MPREARNPLPIFENTRIKVGVKVIRGVPKATQAKFVFSARGADVGTVDAAVQRNLTSANLAKATWTVPAPDAGEDSYELSCRLEMGGQQRDVPQRWLVFPKTIAVTAFKEDKGKFVAQAGAPIVAKQGSWKQEQLTPSSGRLVFHLPEPAPMQLTVAPPCDLLRWRPGKDAGAVREVEYKLVPYTATLVSPAAANAPTRHYVNLPTAEGATTTGTCVVRARLTGTGDLARKKLYVKATFTNDTERGKSTARPSNHPLWNKERTIETLQDAAEQKQGTTVVRTGWVETDDAGEATFRVHLGRGGGEKCEIAVGGTATCEDEKTSLETWRKVFLRVTTSGSQRALATLSTARRQVTKDAFATAFIELDDANGDMRIPAQLPAIGTFHFSGTWIDGADIGKDPGPAVLVATSRQAGNIAAINNATKDTARAGYTVNCIVADFILDIEQVSGSCFAKQITWKGQQKLGGEVLSVYLGAGYMFKNLKLKSDIPAARTTVRYRVYDSRQQGARDAATQKTLAPECILITDGDKKANQPGSCQFLVPPADLAQASQQGWKCEFLFQLASYGEDVDYVGLNMGDACLLPATRQKEEEVPATMTHEIGHAIGMCGDVETLNPRAKNTTHSTFLNRLPDWVPVNAPNRGWYYREHGRWYDKRGHQGDHCADGLSDSLYEGWGKLNSGLHNNTGPTCVIYGQDPNFAVRQNWCPRCLKMLKAMDVWVNARPLANFA